MKIDISLFVYFCLFYVFMDSLLASYHYIFEVSLIPYFPILFATGSIVAMYAFFKRKSWDKRFFAIVMFGHIGIKTWLTLGLFSANLQTVYLATITLSSLFVFSITLMSLYFMHKYY